MASSQKKRRTPAIHRSKTRKSVSKLRGFSLSRWLNNHPRRLIYGSVAAVFILSILSILFVSKTNAATPTSTTSTSTTKSTTTTSKVSCNQAGIQKIVNSVSQTKLKANLQELVQDNTKKKPNALISRHVSSPGNQLKVDWAKKQMKSYGLTVVNQRFTKGKYTVDNLIGRIEGSNPKTLYAISGHIDSINGEDSNKAGKPAPGGNDNGSGTVAAMEAGRVMKAFKPCMKSSVDFIGFNYEETDQEWGSDYYVKQLKKSGKTFKGLYNADMIGYAPKKECMYSYYNNATRDRPMAALLKTVNTKYKIGLPIKVAKFNDEDHDVDSSNFWEEKLASVYLYECDDDDPGYHCTCDTLKNINFSQLTKTTKAMVAAVAELSMK